MKRLMILSAALWALVMCMGPQATMAATSDAIAPVICAPAIILECGADGTCTRTTHQMANVPPFVKVNLKSNVISTMDDSRTSPIMHVDRLKDQVVLTGAESARAWTVVISETTGQMAATASGDDHTFVLFGACTPSPAGAGGTGK